MKGWTCTSWRMAGPSMSAMAARWAVSASEGFLGVAADDGDFDFGMLCKEARDASGKQILTDGL